MQSWADHGTPSILLLLGSDSEPIQREQGHQGQGIPILRSNAMPCPDLTSFS
ncbi:hypothetical protein I79_001715 [Cricetulus griseus]|uniref:Uncharacterized protein n=1 Tax=Cricetulus griseus TaxID=10029 RepID=G3GVH6_CRIGR|nr:hypothetical protein I79_001715 [Cricetulus griseus]